MTNNEKYYAGSLVNLVTDLVRERGKATLSEVAAEFPDKTKKQVHDALSNAQNRRKLKVIFRGSFKGKRESVWAPEVDRPNPINPMNSIKAKPQPVASVWELANPVIEEWPPQFDGGRAYNLLGSWGDESASNDSRQAA